MGNLVRKFKEGDHITFSTTAGDVGRLAVIRTATNCVVLSMSAPEEVRINRGYKPKESRVQREARRKRSLANKANRAKQLSQGQAAGTA
jgi:sRNA-binding carbon storage regulator CsrA